MENSETDCRAVLAHLSAYLDGELAGVACADVKAHIEACGECLQHAEFEKGLKELIRRKCSEGGTPPGLLEKLKEAIDTA